MIAGTIICFLQIPPLIQSETLLTESVVQVEAVSARATTPPYLLDDAMLWQPANSDLLVYTGYSGQKSRLHDWLQGRPIHWAAYQDSGEILLAWTTPDDTLYTASLSESGEQVTAPIPLSQNQAIIALKIVPLTSELNGIFWLSNDEILYLELINREGIPIQSESLKVAENIQRFDVLPSQDNFIRLAWLQNDREVMTALVDGLVLEAGSNFEWQDELELASLSFLNESWLDSLHLLQTEEAYAVVYGIADLVNPNSISYRVIRENTPVFTLDFFEQARWASTNYTRDKLLLSVLEGESWQAVEVDLFDAESIAYLPIAAEQTIDGSPSASRNGRYAWGYLDQNAEVNLAVIDPDVLTTKKKAGRSPFVRI